MKCSQHIFIASALALAVGACGQEQLPGDENGDAGSSDDGIDPSLGSRTDTGTSTSTTGTETTLGGEDVSAGSLDGTGSTTSGESSDEGPVCGEATFVLEAVPPNVVLVLDKSGSMVLEQWDADQDPSTEVVTRWSSLHNVVSFILGNFDEEVNFGMTLFPSLEAESALSTAACGMSDAPEVGVGPQNGAAVLDAIPGAGATSNRIQGGTPATAGIRVARDHLATLDPTIDRFMILVTDGAANCSDDYTDCSGAGCELFEVYDADLPAVVGDAFSVDAIPTFVVGIDILNEVIGESEYDGKPAVNTFEKLNEVAVAGGRPRDGEEKFFNALNEADLQAALQQIAGQVVSCTVPLDPAPEHPNFVSIEIDGQDVPRATDCETEDGWIFVDPSAPNLVRLCNAACDMLGLGGSLDAIYGCPPQG